jgi:hypothetical protein
MFLSPSSTKPNEHETYLHTITIQQATHSNGTRQASRDGLSATLKPAPIELLPYELLATIFECYRSIGGHVQTLLLVSKSWNSICIEHKPLWDTFELSLLAVRPQSCPDDPTRGPYRDYRSHVARFLKISGPTVPLHIHVDDTLLEYDQTGEFVAAFQDLIGSNVGQWKSLKLYEWNRALHSLLVHPTPILESLMMTYPTRSHECTPVDQIFPYAPRLQHLHLGYYFDGELALPPSFLRVHSLVIDRPPRQAYNILRQFHRHNHHLVSLEYVDQPFGYYFPTPDDSDDILDFPSLRHLKLDGCAADRLLAKLELPALEELYLAIESTGPRSIRPYAASPNLRRVKKLTVHGGLRNGAAEFKELLRSTPALESLQMYAMEGVERVLEESIELIPNLDRCKLGWKSLGWIVHSARIARRMSRPRGQV